jgi:hypothetical protein
VARGDLYLTSPNVATKSEYLKKQPKRYLKKKSTRTKNQNFERTNTSETTGHAGIVIKKISHENDNTMLIQDLLDLQNILVGFKDNVI